MSTNDRDHVAERVGHMLDEQQHIVEGAIIDWLRRTGQWDSEGEAKVRRWLEELARQQEEAAVKPPKG